MKKKAAPSNPLLTYARELQRTYPAITDDALNAILAAPVVDGMNAAEYERWRQRVPRFTAERRRGWKAWQDRDRKLRYAHRLVKETPFMGQDAPARKAAILAELERQRIFRGRLRGSRLKSLAAQTRPHAWLTPLAVNLSDYLRRCTGCGVTRVYTMTAEILARGSDEKITMAMVKDRVERHKNDK